MDSSSSGIKIQNVWKVFGNTSPEALDAIQNKGISKTEALEEYNSVIDVSDVSFDVNQGEIFCVMGLSGSGKSTLVRHINRLLEPTSGQILINGQDVMKLDRENLQELRNKKIGMVFQNFALMPHRSVVDNIAMPLEIRGVSKNDRLDAANKILEIVELQGWGNKFAHELSGGMQQRVGLARALAADPVDVKEIFEAALSVAINQNLPPLSRPAVMTSELLTVVVTLVPSKLLYLASTEALLGAKAYCPLPAVSMGKK